MQDGKGGDDGDDAGAGMDEEKGSGSHRGGPPPAGGGPGPAGGGNGGNGASKGTKRAGGGPVDDVAGAGSALPPIDGAAASTSCRGSVCSDMASRRSR